MSAPQALPRNIVRGKLLSNCALGARNRLVVVLGFRDASAPYVAAVLRVPVSRHPPWYVVAMVGRRVFCSWPR